MASFRSRRSAIVPTHPHEPKLSDVLNMMRKRDIHELLKAKRRGELDQMLQGLYASVMAEHSAKYEGQFQGAFDSEGMDESKTQDASSDKDSFRYPFPSVTSPEPDKGDSDNLTIEERELREREKKEDDEKSVKRVTMPISKNMSMDSVNLAKNVPSDTRSIIVRGSSSFAQKTPLRPKFWNSTQGSIDLSAAEESDFSDTDTSSPRHSVQNSSLPRDFNKRNSRMGIPRKFLGSEDVSRYSLRSNVTAGTNSRNGTWRSDISNKYSLRSAGTGTGTMKSESESHADSDFDDMDSSIDERKRSRGSARSFRSANRVVCSYDTLKSRGGTLTDNNTSSMLPAGVDPNNREQHLTDEDFEMVFKMNRASFYKLTKWRRQELKKRHNIL